MSTGLLLLLASAAPLTIDATLSDTSVMLGDIVTVQLVAVATVDGQIQLDVPPIDGLTEMSRSRSEGTSISWTNAGQSMRRELTVNIELSADRVGKVKIPAISAKVRNAVAKTKPVEIQVLGDDSAPTQKAPAGSVVPPSKQERRLFVRYRIDKERAYLGQQLLVDLEIFTLPGQSFSVEEREAPPELDGFWREIVDQPNRLVRRTERVDGRRYDVYRAWRVALFPLTAGTKTIPPASITFSTGRSLFNSGRRIRRRAVPLSIEVLPLPTEGRPGDFSNNNVGQFALKATVDHRKVRAGKAVLLSIALSGRGNIKNARLPEVKAIDGFRVFPPTISDEVETGLQGIRGKKKAEILLMPERGGRLEIPAFDLTIFDPMTVEYRRLSTESIRIVVEGDPTETAPRTVLPPVAEAERRKVNRSDLQPLRFRSALRTATAPVWRRPIFAGMLAGPPLFFLLWLLGERLVARSRKETDASRKKAASQAARQRIDAARSALERQDITAAYTELTEAIHELGSARLGVALRGMTTEQIVDALQARAAPADMVQGVAELLQAGDFARFAGAGAGRPDLERAQALLSQLDAWAPESAS